MSFNDNKVVALDFKHQSMPDRPSTIYSTSEFKAALDSQAEQLQAGLNGLIDSLLIAVAGSSASEQLGAAPIAGVSGTTVYQQLLDLKAQIQAIVGGSVPTGSITTAMIQNGAITYSKLSPDVVAAIDKNPQIIALERVQANLVAIAEINGLSIGQTGYGYDLFRGSSDNIYSAAKMDTTRGRIAGTISGGQTSVTVTDVQGTFAPGQEVTLQDVVSDTARQKLIIQSVVGSTITFATPTNAYAANAQLYRSLASIDIANKKLEFGAAVYPGSTITAAPNTIAAVTPSGITENTNARRTVRTARGWMVHATSLSTTDHRLYISKDGGVNWSQLCSNSISSAGSGELGVYGDTVFWCIGYIALYKVDTLSQTNVDIVLTGKQVSAKGTSAIPSMAIDSKGYIHISTTTSGLGSNNWIYCVSEDAGATFSESEIALPSGYNGNNMLLLDKNENAVFFVHDTTSPYSCYMSYKSASGVYTPKTTGLSATAAGWCGIVKRSGSNIGRIIIVYSNSAAQYSDDNGETFTTANPSFGATGMTSQLTEDSSGNVHCVFHSTATTLSVTSMLNGTSTWTAPVSYDGTSIVSGTPISTLEYGGSFTVPIAVYNRTGSTVIRGTYTPILSKDFTQVDVRYNITPPSGTLDELRSWIQYDDFTGFTVQSAFSVVGPSANESFIAMTASNADFGSIIETYFEGATATANTKAAQRITMTRSSTSNNVGVSKYLAAIIAP